MLSWASASRGLFLLQLGNRNTTRDEPVMQCEAQMVATENEKYKTQRSVTHHKNNKYLINCYRTKSYQSRATAPSVPSSYRGSRLSSAPGNIQYTASARAMETGKSDFAPPGTNWPPCTPTAPFLSCPVRQLFPLFFLSSVSTKYGRDETCS